MKTKILIVVILICMVIACSGCQYNKEENISNNESGLQNNDVKTYTEEEINKMFGENKYPKAYIKDTNEGFGIILEEFH